MIEHCIQSFTPRSDFPISHIPCPASCCCKEFLASFFPVSSTQHKSCISNSVTSSKKLEDFFRCITQFLLRKTCLDLVNIIIIFCLPFTASFSKQLSPLSSWYTIMVDKKELIKTDIQTGKVKDLPLQNILNFRDIGKTINSSLGKRYAT